MQDKKKILFVMDGMKIGGVESALISVFHYLDFDRYDVDLLLLHDHDELKDEIPPEVSLFYLERSKSYGKGISFYCFRVLMSFFRLFHMPRLSAKAADAMRYAARRKRSEKLLPCRYHTVIAYKHGEAESFAAFCIKAENKILFYHHGSIIDDTLHRRAFGHFQKIVAVSEGVKEMLAEQYPDCKERLCVIPNYVDPDYILNRSAAYTVERPEVPLVLCTVGRLSPEKNFLLALETAAELKERGKKFVWFIVGDGKQRQELETYRDSRGLKEEVIFTGALKNPLPYVLLCDIYIQTSHVESYGLSIQEALILKKPVVSTKTIGGQTLLAGVENAVLTDSDAGCMADGIERLLQTRPQTEDPVWRQKDEETKKLWQDLLRG